MMKTNSAMPSVTMMWLVKVKLTIGIRPSMLPNRMNMKSVKMKGKYLRPSSPTLSRIISPINVYIASATDCHRPGTISRRDMPITMKTVTVATVIVIHRDELVKAKESMAPPPTVVI